MAEAKTNTPAHGEHDMYNLQELTDKVNHAMAALHYDGADKRYLAEIKRQMEQLIDNTMLIKAQAEAKENELQQIFE